METEMVPGLNILKAAKERLNLTILMENLMVYNHIGIQMGIK